MLALTAGALMILGLVWFELDDHVVYFLTPQELQEQAEQLIRKQVRVGGMVEVGSLLWNQQQLKAEFVLSDLNKARIQVSYAGLLPDMFREGQGVVVEGSLHEKGMLFLADTLMVKHSEEYQPPGDHPSMDSELLRRSLLGSDTADADARAGYLNVGEE